MNYTGPTPIQAYTIPTVLAGRDVIATAQTGSGKTVRALRSFVPYSLQAAYLLPSIQLLFAKDIKPVTFFVDEDNGMRVPCPRVVVVAPTRELCQQIHNEAHKFATGTGYRVALCQGGVNVRHERSELARGVTILVASPGRLEQIIKQNMVSRSSKCREACAADLADPHVDDRDRRGRSTDGGGL